MKNLITIFIMLIAVGRATTPTLEERVVGTYEIKQGEDSIRMVFLENGMGAGYVNGKKQEGEGKWKIANGEIHVGIVDKVEVFRINPDVSITWIARIDKDGKRRDIPKEGQGISKRSNSSMPSKRD